MSFWAKLLAMLAVGAALLIARSDSSQASDRGEIPTGSEGSDGAQDDAVALPEVAVSPPASTPGSTQVFSAGDDDGAGRVFVSDIFRPPISALA